LTELLDVAAEIFISEGFSAASTNEIARRANSSKTTFYSRFPTKEHLFLAVIERRINGIFQQVAGSLPEERPIEETLQKFGSALIRLALSKEQIALIRVVSMEAARFPELGKRYYELGPKRAEERLAAYLRKQVEGGRLLNEDTRQMAQHFVSLVSGGPVRWFVLGFDPIPMSKNAIHKHLDSAVLIFMRAYQCSPAK
jgi:TetR/AcrR family transcriptional repressor of mexJK operon